jgi:formamidopyrimidine-DNA glycosylase
LSGRYTKKKIEGLESAGLPTRVLGIGVKGKLIFWLLDNDSYILNTLGMTGGWSEQKGCHSRVQFNFETGNPVYFNDTRNFGTIKFIRGRIELTNKLYTLGPDMLSEDVSDEVFRFSLEKYPDKTLPEVLMDQNVISGVGNYVKAESLWKAQLSPHRTVGSLNKDEMSTLNSCIKIVLKQAYEDQGASFKDFQNSYGEKGKATQNFCVYGCKKDIFGNDVKKEETKDGRVTHWSPAHQK